MPESFRALSNNFYINQRLSLKLDLPRERQTILDLFDRVRRQFPDMTQFRRMREELALESAPGESDHRWIAVRNTSIRAGVVDPAQLGDAYNLHRHVLDIAPYFLSISPLDVDYLELLFGFDLLATGNHDAIVYDALVADSPMGRAMDLPGGEVSDCQPLLGVTFQRPSGRAQRLEICLEIKTRPAGRPSDPEAAEPISVYLAVRKYGPMGDVKELPGVLTELARQGESLVESRIVPNIVKPLREAIGPVGRD